MPSGARSPRKKRHVERPDMRTTLLDAAEALVREEGYAAATARGIATRVGVKHPAVYYYFGSQDELLLALLQRSMESHRQRLTTALNSEHPLRAMWQIVSDPASNKIGLEFMALANHNELIRAEIAKNSVAVRALEGEAVTRYLNERGISPRLSPLVVTFLTNAMARLLIQETTLGVDVGHDEVEAFVEQCLSSFEAWGGANTSSG